VSTWRLLTGELACTELFLLILDDSDGSCGGESDIILLRPGDGVISPPCVGRGVGGVRLRRWGDVGEESPATGSRGLSSVAVSGGG
jgi:hypothetical protein